MSCDHTFFLVAPDGTKGMRALILKRIAVCGLPGFALHWIDPDLQESHGFRVSHIATGALCSVGGSFADSRDAIRNAEESLQYGAQIRSTSPREELERVVSIARQARERAGWPMEDKER